MDEASTAMEVQGIVRLIRHEGQELADGEPAYSIELADKGRKDLPVGIFPKFQDLDL